MKVRFLSVVFLGMMVFACMSCQQKAGLSEQDQAAIKKICADAAEMAVGPNVDWDAYVSHVYTEDAKFLMPGIPILEGRDAIKAAFSSMGTVQDLKFNAVSIEGRGDLAYEHGTYSETIIPPGSSTAISDKGKYIVVWKKQADGNWKAAYDIANSDLSPAGLVLPTGALKEDSGPELERLEWLIGSWRLDGQSKGSSFISAGKMSATLDSQWFSGGSQVLCLYNVIYPNGPVQELSVYGYDPEAKAYWCYSTDSTGLSSLGKVVIEESGWTHVWDYRIEGKPVKMRLVLFDLTPEGCAWKNEYSMAGGPWTPLAEGTATRIK